MPFVCKSVNDVICTVRWFGYDRALRPATGREVTLAYGLRDWRAGGGGVNRAPLYVLSFTLQLSKIADARGVDECWEQFVLSNSLSLCGQRGLKSLSAVLGRALIENLERQYTTVFCAGSC
jgi:hypothetical protein